MRIVVKIGGSLMKEGVPGPLIRDVASLTSSNQVVLVHGGGDVVTDFATRLGKEQRFVVSPEGIRSRYTDKETIEIYQMVMTGFLAKRLVLALEKEGVKSVSLSGVDGSMMRGTRKSRLVIMDDRGRKVAIEGGYTGKVKDVDPALVNLALSNGYVPVVSPVAVSEKGDPLNVDGDRAAASVAAGLEADAVIFATNVDGLTLDGTMVRRTTSTQASSDLPKIGFGMQKKVMAAVEAVDHGVKEALICSGTRDSPISRAIAQESCTVIVPP
jgi:[amino group carrier protein]-L-2-aminoadipate 6-kinase